MLPPSDIEARVDLGIASIKAESLSNVSGDFIVFVKAGDLLSLGALYEFANAINASPSLDMIYADEDRISLQGKRLRPFFKPDWSPDYLETFNYVGYPACFRSTVAKECLQTGNYYDFILESDSK